LCISKASFVDVPQYFCNHFTVEATDKLSLG